MQGIVDYYDENASSYVTDKFLESLYAEFDFIKMKPNSFQIKYRDSRVRYLKSFPFGIHYRIKNKTIIEILAVLHTSRNPEFWIKR
ncbi:type II toxin-antitoxin system RelE/ParE family toxin [Polaribacter reichenbachii]|uniref:type II toxin-antitoxin system RelE/ParE family toxin n=1 Tax=Polaribacter reichenbachii TaxID=996801 RepID=UPI0009F1972B